MGKIKRIKQERKLEEIKKTEKKKATKKIIKKIFLGMIIAAVAVSAGLWANQKYKPFEKKSKSTAQSTKDIKRNYEKAPEMTIDKNKEYIATFKTNKGDFKAKLFASDSPKTVNNFVFLAKNNFYNGLTFHRIIKDFMIQGGDPKGDGGGGPGYKFEDEFNSHKLVRGSLAMANRGPNTNGSQFFIVTKDKTDWLDGKHTNFGEIISGLDKVMAISELPTGEDEKPKDQVIISSIEIEEK